MKNGNIIARYGRIAELRKAMKSYKCSECGKVIESGQFYYAVTIAGGGLGSIKFPARVHEGCLDLYLERYK